MALEPLAAVADLTNRSITFDPAEQTLVDTYLAVASSSVRDAAGSPVLQTTSTVSLTGSLERKLRLPGLPVTGVSSVELDGDPITDWKLVRGSDLWRRRGWQRLCDEPSEITVTYTHGMPKVPADIVDLVCRMVAGALSASRAEDDGSGLAVDNVRSERIDDYGVTYRTEDGYVTEMALPDLERRRLAARFGGGVHVVSAR